MTIGGWSTLCILLRAPNLRLPGGKLALAKDSPNWLVYAIIFDAVARIALRGATNKATASMVSTERPTAFVHLLPKLIAPGSLRGAMVVVVDVLRATTVMVHALAAGCQAVIPCGEIDEAKAVVSRLPPGMALLAGERQGVRIPGFDLGNSPAEFTAETCAGKILVMTTTNGTKAILASLEAKRIYIASFANLNATVEQILVKFQRRDRAPLHIICAGTEGFISLEDSLLAGALVARLLVPAGEIEPDGARLGNDEALIVVSAWLEVDRYVRRRPLSRLLSLGRGGQNVQRIGLADDLDDAAVFDRFSLVAELCRDGEFLRIVAV
jgi:2-phosphosulfolactate phosphatase